MCPTVDRRRLLAVAEDDRGLAIGEHEHFGRRLAGTADAFAFVHMAQLEHRRQCLEVAFGHVVERDIESEHRQPFGELLFAEVAADRVVESHHTLLLAPPPACLGDESVDGDRRVTGDACRLPPAGRDRAVRRRPSARRRRFSREVKATERFTELDKIGGRGADVHCAVAAECVGVCRPMRAIDLSRRGGVLPEHGRQ